MNCVRSIATALLVGTGILCAQNSSPPFELTNPDFERSPHSGMNRQHWIDCGRFILDGAFRHVKSLEDPMLFPKIPGVSYPKDGYDECPPEQRSAAIFEGIARTFNIAAPLIAEDPELTLNGIRVADYYKYQILRLTDPKCPYFIGHGERNDGPAQQTCELGNLAMWMLLLPESLWEKLDKAEKNQIATAMQGWSGGWTKTHNWRWFNVMMMTFLKHNGYPIDEQLMLNHLDHLLMLESGEGWFRDKSHDYYTVHVFQLYGSIWNRFYGWKNEPARAAEIDRQFHRFMENYPMFFGRQGQVNMWGRSIVYRMGASAALSAAFVRGGDPGIDPGTARRLASGAMLHFVTHPGFFQNGVPSLGFFGPFEPAIQSYSCAASPFWMFMNYTALTLPKDSTFWTARENEGAWEKAGTATRTKFLPGAGLLVANHGLTGTSEIINAKVHDTDPDYCRLRYNTDFPWETNSKTGPTAASLTIDAPSGNAPPAFPESINSAGWRDGVLYRQVIFKKDSLGGTPAICDLADITVPGGQISIQRFRQIKPSMLFSAHYGLPHLPEVPQITERVTDGKNSTIASIPGRQLAVTNYQGWDAISTVTHQGQHPEADQSTLLHLTRKEDARYGAPQILISILLHKTDDSSWTDDSLQPIRSVEPLTPGAPLALGGLHIILKSGNSYRIDFRGIDGSSSR